MNHIVIRLDGLHVKDHANALLQCDVQKPRCGNCERRREHCEFLHDVQPWTPPTTVSSVSSPALAVTKDPQPAPVATLNLMDLELLHHFSTVVYSTLCGEEKVQRMWQLSIPKEALKHSHLMNSILAISALHLSSTCARDERQKYFAAAIQHNNIALSGFNLLLNNVTEENGDSTIANSCLLAIFSAAMWNNPGNPQPQSPIEGIMEVATLTRGIHVIMNAGGPFLRQGRLSPLLNPKPWDDSPVLPPDVISALDAIREKARSSYTADRASIYLEAIQSLHRTFEASEVNRDHLPIALLWLVLLERDFIELLKAKDSMALVIFAHFGAVCQAASTLWWANDWDSIIVEEAHQALDDEWRPWISWPVRKIEDRLRRIFEPRTNETSRKLPDPIL